MHGDLVLGGPVWLFATVIILITLLLALFVLLDAMRPARRRQITERARAVGRRAEPLWFYAAVEAAFLGALLVAQVWAGISLVSAVPVALAPFALAMGIAYLLRVVFPRHVTSTLEAGCDESDEGCRTPFEDGLGDG